MITLAENHYKINQKLKLINRRVLKKKKINQNINQIKNYLNYKS